MFNTLKFVKLLEDAGISRAHAEAHIEVISEIVEADVASKTDLIQLEQRLVIKLAAIMGTLMTLSIAIVTAIVKLN